MTTITGDPAKLRTAATTLSDRADALDSHSRGVRCQHESLAAAWLGTAATQYACVASTHASDAYDAAEQLRPLASGVRTFADALERHQTRERTLEAQLATAEADLREARTAVRLGPLDTGGASAADVTAALARIRRLHHDLEQLRADHRTSLRGLHLTLTTYTPPKPLWLKGMNAYGMGLAYWNLYQKGSATYWLWKTRGPVVDPVLAGRRTGALTAVEKGTVTGFLEKGWMTKVFSGKRAGLLLKTARAASGAAMLEAMVPGAKDVVTGGGYTGWRDPATRAMGLVEIGGVLLARNPETTVPGAVVLTTYAVWKAGNKAYDNKDSLDDKDFWEAQLRRTLQDHRQQGDLGIGGIGALWWLDQRADHRMQGHALWRVFDPPRRPERERLTFGPPAPWRHRPVPIDPSEGASPFARWPSLVAR